MSKKKSLKEDKLKKLKNLNDKILNTREPNDFDFGGISKEISLKKNIGCGG